jgi:uncharacterized protein (DUF2235 family)
MTDILTTAAPIAAAPTTPRNIVLCLDGTSNKYAAVNTNVVKLYAMLDRARPDQLSYYQPGIGTMPPPGVFGRLKRWFLTRLDLAIAWLLSDHVTDAYRFLMRYYQQGDRIFIFGFSRGSYTARAVAAMLHKVGLLTQGNEELIPFAWDMFKREHDRAVYDGFKKTFCRPAPVYFLGLWDTVSSVGWVPFAPQHFQYTANNPDVAIVRHAVALDERRAYFVQNLWGTDPPTDLDQVWFPGVHCDVGGGAYPENESGLSATSLKWMTDKAEAAGLILDPQMKAAVLPERSTSAYVAPFAGDPAHESLSGLWWIPEFIPKRYKDPAANFVARWMLPMGRPRHVNENAKIHTSVFERMRLVQEYKPKNLPQVYEEVT